ncbi:MAG: sn-glycerol-1-phosphate dehydrogenase [Lachnospiraceae bacterium]|nr:sn-glycerol-1-phosphate dehydrogenase [Lachnospiraceae bacterium]
MQNRSIEPYLNCSFECGCGRTHKSLFAHYIFEQGAIEKLPALLSQLGYTKPYLISDTHTYAIAGIVAEEVLHTAGIHFTSHVLKSPENGDLAADEHALGSVAMANDKDADIIISIGTGTINDLGRYFSYITGKPFMLIATAPSMDGLVSGVAPLIFHNMKITFPAQEPLALICDPEIMAKAPLKMLAAGAADILGKYNCLLDWKLSHIINDEYYCDTIAGIMRTAVDQTMESTKGLASHDSKAVSVLTEALVLSGIAMDFSGNSRPASGAEHHQSHYWEMQFLFDGIPAVLHGTKVGIGTVLMLELYNTLAEMEKPDFAKIRAEISQRLSMEDWEKEMHRCYRDGAEGIIELEKKSKKNNPDGLLKRLAVIEEKWDEIRSLAQTAPKASEIYHVLEQMGAAKIPADVGIPRQYVYDSIRYGKELRDRYTILQLMWDIGRLDENAGKLVDKYCAEK